MNDHCCHHAAISCSCTPKHTSTCLWMTLSLLEFPLSRALIPLAITLSICKSVMAYRFLPWCIGNPSRRREQKIDLFRERSCLVKVFWTCKSRQCLWSKGGVSRGLWCICSLVLSWWYLVKSINGIFLSCFGAFLPPLVNELCQLTCCRTISSHRAGSCVWGFVGLGSRRSRHSKWTWWCEG